MRCTHIFHSHVRYFIQFGMINMQWQNVLTLCRSMHLYVRMYIYRSAGLGIVYRVSNAVYAILELCACVIKLHVYRVVCASMSKQRRKHAASHCNTEQTSIIFYLIINSQLCINRKRQATVLGFQCFDTVK